MFRRERTSCFVLRKLPSFPLSLVGHRLAVTTAAKPVVAAPVTLTEIAASPPLVSNFAGGPRVRDEQHVQLRRRG